MDDPRVPGRSRQGTRHDIHKPKQHGARTVMAPAGSVNYSDTQTYALFAEQATHNQAVNPCPAMTEGGGEDPADITSARSLRRVPHSLCG